MSEMIIFAVPGTHNSFLNDLKEQIGQKILVDIVVPLSKNDPKVSMPQKVQPLRQLNQFWVMKHHIGALHNVSATTLQNLNWKINCDILVCGNNLNARKQVMSLIEK